MRLSADAEDRNRNVFGPELLRQPAVSNDRNEM